MKNKFKIVYLPLAYTDLIDIIRYIRNELKAPKTAQDLINKFNESISNLVEYPYAGKKYVSNEEFDQEYRFLVVDNYLVFYIVGEELVEIRRIIFGKRQIVIR